ncbi:MAG: ATP synthase F1 subunit delta [Clostridiales Family XIII bacterium]|jgi:ATP synthase F1 delta subunit|nr:ATP synthase F1 subunit delta [Clostridiales Family XIII bacterium]
MDPLTVADTYGQALYDAAKEAGRVAEIGEELDGVSGVFKEYPELPRIFTVPTLNAPDKKKAAKAVFDGRVSQELLNFLYVLIDHHRIGAWSAIARRYAALVDEAEGLAKGVLYSAVPIEGQRLAAFETEAGKAVGKKVRLENRIDGTLIGGVVLYIDGKLVDLSVKNRLERMKQKMLG